MKTGKIPVSTSPQDTCPPSCPLRGQGCYADGGPLRLHWNKVTNGERGVSYTDFLASIRKLPDKQLWRHNQCGDLIPCPGDRERIDKDRLSDLVEANKGKRGYTYTHYDVLSDTETAAWNREVIKKANEDGFIINLSADTTKEADAMVKLQIAPVTVMLPSDATKASKTPDGNIVAVCPNVTCKVASCLKCGLCAKNHKAIIGFPAHGSKKRPLTAALKAME